MQDGSDLNKLSYLASTEEYAEGQQEQMRRSTGPLARWERIAFGLAMLAGAYVAANVLWRWLT